MGPHPRPVAILINNIPEMGLTWKRRTKSRDARNSFLNSSLVSSESSMATWAAGALQSSSPRMPDALRTRLLCCSVSARVDSPTSFTSSSGTRSPSASAINFESMSCLHGVQSAPPTLRGRLPASPHSAASCSSAPARAFPQGGLLEPLVALVPAPPDCGGVSAFVVAPTPAKTWPPFLWCPRRPLAA